MLMLEGGFWVWATHKIDLQLKFEEHHQVAPDATESEITKQYRRLSVWHLETRHGMHGLDLKLLN